jgi:peptide chain release factor 1
VPTGVVVTCQSERNQMQNRETAMSILSAKLVQAQEEADLSKLSAERREQIGWAKRSEKIRTYNFPQNRLTDHRINKSWHNLESIMEGDLEPVMKAFKKQEKTD